MSNDSRDAPLDRAFAILDFVARQPRPATAARIAAGLDLPTPTAHRLIANLETRGFLLRAPASKGYAVGNTLVELAGHVIAASFRTARRHAVLQKLAAEIGEQCEIGTVRHNTVAYVDSVRVSPPKGLQFDPGSNAPLHCTSTGKIYLSRLPRAAREKLVRALPLTSYTTSTITDPDALLAVLSETRASGWARTNEEYVKGVVGCAVPILAPDGVLLACVGVSVPVARVSYEDLEHFRAPLNQAAALLAETFQDSEDGAASQAPNSP